MEGKNPKQMPLGLLDIQAVICLPVLAARHHFDDLHSHKATCSGQHLLLCTLWLTHE